MRPVFVNSADIRAREAWMLKGGSWRRKLTIPTRYGIIAHPDGGVLLVDTGYGPEVTLASQRSGALRFHNWLLRPKLLEGRQPERVLEMLGYRPADVRAIMVTHYHPDHISGLARFPGIPVITNRTVFDLIASRTSAENARKAGVSDELLPSDLSARIVALETMRQIAAPFGLGQGWDIFSNGSVLGIDLPGHADGHFGLCFPNLDRPLLYAVDAQWLLAAILEDRPAGFPLGTLITHDATAERRTRAKIAAFYASGGEVLLCHDPSASQYDIIG